MEIDEVTALFELARPKLMGIAYRFLGTISDAEDVVQDVYLKWSATDVSTLDNPKAWLNTVCARTCLDVIRSVERKRVDYVGTWLPEPVQTEADSELDNLKQMELTDSLTTAFVLMLERLTPKERAAYLLYEIFDTPYKHVAEALEIQESACRKLVSRAKINVEKSKTRCVIPFDKQTHFLNAFKMAITEGEQSHLQDLLANDIVIRADGGGKVSAIQKAVTGNQSVIEFLVKDLNHFWQDFIWIETRINGNSGFIIKEKEDIHAVVSFGFNDNAQASEVFIVRNPEKIKFLNAMPIN